MKIHLRLAIASCGMLLISCSTQQPTDSSAIRDAYAWLDTSPRASQQPARSADGITHWNAGLPTAHAARTPAKNRSRSTEATRSRQWSGASAYQGNYDATPGYATHYRVGHGYRRGSRRPTQPTPFQYQGKPSDQGRSTYVGPSIVPQGIVPLVDRSQKNATGYHGTQNNSKRGNKHNDSSSHRHKTRNGYRR